MKRIQTNNEKRLLKTVSITITIITALIMVVYYWLSSIPKFKESIGLPITFLIILIAISFLFFLKGHWILKILFKTFGKISKKPIIGKWTILIQYGDINGIETKRTGPLEIEDSYFGLNIKGGSLFDYETNKIEVQSWKSIFAICFKYERKEVFVYQYITYEDGNRKNPTKTGTVNLKKENDDLYLGVFKDFKADDGKLIREGLVKLYKFSDSTEEQNSLKSSNNK